MISAVIFYKAFKMILIKFKYFFLFFILNLLHFSDCNRVKRIVGGRAVDPPPVDDPVVFIRQDDKEAVVYGSRDSVLGYYLFRGIRYAEPPVGNKRFQVSKMK